MSASTSTRAIESLFDYLDNLTERATVDELQQRLTASDISLSDIAASVHFSDRGYLRNLIREGEHYHALALCWQSGQRSPIHNHAGSTCGLRVLTGIATETIFDHSPSRLIKPVESFDRHTGAVAVSQDADIHQVSNLQPAGTDLVTLHIYSPPLLRMDTYSLTDAHVGEFRPSVLSHDQGSGI